MVRLSRRAMLGLAGGAALASTGLGYAAVRSFSDEDLVRATLENYLGHLSMTDDHLRAFVSQLRERKPWIFPTEKLADAATLAGKAGLSTLARRLLPSDDLGQLERFDRWTLAEFHLLTDYAWRSDPGAPVQFTGLEQCTNPFAKFENEEAA